MSAKSTDELDPRSTERVEKLTTSGDRVNVRSTDSTVLDGDINVVLLGERGREREVRIEGGRGGERGKSEGERVNKERFCSHPQRS